MARCRDGRFSQQAPGRSAPGVIAYSMKSTVLVPGTVIMTSSGARPAMLNPALRSQESPEVTWYWPAGSWMVYLPAASVTVWVSFSVTAFSSHPKRTYARGYAARVSRLTIRPDTVAYPLPPEGGSATGVAVAVLVTVTVPVLVGPGPAGAQATSVSART